MSFLRAMCPSEGRMDRSILRWVSSWFDTDHFLLWIPCFTHSSRSPERSFGPAGLPCLPAFTSVMSRARMTRAAAIPWSVVSET